MAAAGNPDSSASRCTLLHVKVSGDWGEDPERYRTRGSTSRKNDHGWNDEGSFRAAATGGAWVVELRPRRRTSYRTGARRSSSR